MKAKAMTFAVLSALSAGAMAAGYDSGTQGPIGPNTRIPDNATAVAAPAPAYAAPAPAYGTPANPPVADSTVVQQNPVWVTRGVAQSGPGTVDKTRPGYPDDNTGHSAWDVGTSSAGG